MNILLRRLSIGVIALPLLAVLLLPSLPPDEIVMAAQPSEAVGVMVMPRSTDGVQVAAQALVGAYSISRQYPTGLVVINAPPNQEEKVASDIMAKHPNLHAEPNWVIRLDDPKNVEIGAAQADNPEESWPNDPYFYVQWGARNINLPCAWEEINTTSDVKIAVLDTGGPRNHPDLPIATYRNITTDPHPYDEHGHATHVIGITAAVGNNGVGVAGVSWNAPIVSIKVTNSTGFGTYADLASGVDIAREEKVRVANISLVGSQPSYILEQAIRHYQAAGGIVVAARGNTGTNVPLYPAHYADLSVGATGPTNKKTPWSSWGGTNYLVAPGEQIFSTHLEKDYSFASGTSMAAPQATGVVGLIAAQHPDWSRDEIIKQVFATADKVGGPEVYGFGKVNACRAVRGNWAHRPRFPPEEVIAEAGRLVEQ